MAGVVTKYIGLPIPWPVEPVWLELKLLSKTLIIYNVDVTQLAPPSFNPGALA